MAKLKSIGNFYFDAEKLDSIYYNQQRGELNICINKVMYIFEGKEAEEMFNQFKELLENGRQVQTL